MDTNLLPAYARYLYSKKTHTTNNSAGFNLPGGYIQTIIQLQEKLNNRRAALALARGYKYPAYNSNFKVQPSEAVYLGMYNATADLGDSIELAPITAKVKKDGLISKTIDGYQIKAVKYTTRYGRFQTSFEYTEEYGSRAIVNNAPEPSGVEFILKITKGGVTKGASFTIFGSGRIRFSGGYVAGSADEPSVLLKYMDMLYLPSHPDLTLVVDVNNITSEIKLGVGIDVNGLYALISASSGSARFRAYDIDVKFEPGRDRNTGVTKQGRSSPFLYVSFSKDKVKKFTLVISSNGTISVEGATDIKTALKVVKDFANGLGKIGLLNTKNTQNKKITPKASKVARRANMKPAPEITRRGTTCPVGKRPKPYSFQGVCRDGMYVAPNPQGQPCCYAIPKRLSYSKQKVADAYAAANVKVPDHVRKLFGIGANTNNKLNNVGRKAPTNLEMRYNSTIGKGGKPVGFKVGSRQCSRYSKVALLDLAKRLGLRGIPTKTTIPILCKMLQDASGNKTKAPPSVLNSFKLKKRVCTSYNKTTLSKFATELGIRVTPVMTRDQICTAIRSKVKPVASPPKKKTPSPPKKKTPSPPKKVRFKTPSPPPKKKVNNNSNNENFNNLLNFAKRFQG